MPLCRGRLVTNVVNTKVAVPPIDLGKRIFWDLLARLFGRRLAANLGLFRRRRIFCFLFGKLLGLSEVVNINQEAY